MPQGNSLLTKKNSSCQNEVSRFFLLESVSDEKMHFLWILTFAVFSVSALPALDLGEIVSQLPNCTVSFLRPESRIEAILTPFPKITCSTEKLAAAGCLLTDMQNCLCTNTTLQNELFICVLQSCNLTEQVGMLTTSTLGGGTG